MQNFPTIPVSKNYFKLGQLPRHAIEFFKEEIIKRRGTDSFEWIQFDKPLHDYWLDMFENEELKLQWNPAKEWFVQKAFWSEPGAGFRIHKDGLRCKSALNIAITCNDGDWVRWYDDAFVHKISDTEQGQSRNVEIDDYENVPFIEEIHNKLGDVYIINTDVFHSFKCSGPEPRIIIQTKFEGFPDFETIKASLIKKSFSVLQNSLE